MAAHEEIYVSPAVEDVLPEEVVRRLDGSDLETKAKEAIRISTVDSDGWPHAALAFRLRGRLRRRLH
jgi:hypothetical protein